MARHNVSPRAWLALDRYLDDLAEGRPPDAAGLDPGLRRAADRLHQATGRPIRRVVPIPSPQYVMALGEERRVAAVPRGERRVGARVLRPLSFVSALAIFALIVAGFFMTILPAGRAGVDDGFWVYMVDHDRGLIVELDRDTLLPTDRVIRTFEPWRDDEPPAFHYWWMLSADGSTLVESRSNTELERYGFEPAASLSVFDTATSRQRATIAATASQLLHVAADGTRIVLVPTGVFTVGSGGPSAGPPLQWLTYDATTGALLGSVQTHLTRPDHPTGVVSPDATVAFQLAVDPGIQGEGPWPTKLAMIDLTRQAEPVLVEVPGLRTGRWAGESFSVPDACNVGPDGEIIARNVTALTEFVESAGLAVSPDGSTVAVAHPDGVTVTLVDVASASVIRTMTVDAPPESASTYESTCWRGSGRYSAITFNDEGTAVLLSGSRVERPDAETETTIHVGLRRVDLASGETAATRLPVTPGTQAWYSILRASDASVLVASFASTPGAAEGGLRMLREMDGETLVQRRAVRMDSEWPEFLVSRVRTAPFSPEPPAATPVGATSVVVRAQGEDLDHLRIEVDGAVVFDGPLANRRQTGVLTGTKITITSSDPSHTIIVTIGGQTRIMREETETYPRE